MGKQYIHCFQLFELKIEKKVLGKHSILMLFLFYVALMSNSNLLSASTLDNYSTPQEKLPEKNSTQISQLWTDGYPRSPFINYWNPIQRAQ